MTVTYVQEDIFGAGSSPWTSSAFTPTAGNCLPTFVSDGNGGHSFTISGTGTFSLLSPPGQFTDVANDTWGHIRQYVRFAHLADLWGNRDGGG